MTISPPAATSGTHDVITRYTQNSLDLLAAQVRILLADQVTPAQILAALAEGGLAVEAIAERLSLVSVTDPDQGATNRVYFDDQVVDVVEFVIDPGVGYSRADWNGMRDGALSCTTGTLHADIASAYADAGQSPHIVGEDDHA